MLYRALTSLGVPSSLVALLLFSHMKNIRPNKIWWNSYWFHHHQQLSTPGVFDCTGLVDFILFFSCCSQMIGLPLSMQTSLLWSYLKLTSMAVCLMSLKLVIKLVSSDLEFADDVFLVVVDWSLFSPISFHSLWWRLFSISSVCQRVRNKVHGP